MRVSYLTSHATTAAKPQCLSQPSVRLLMPSFGPRRRLIIIIFFFFTTAVIGRPKKRLLHPAAPAAPTPAAKPAASTHPAADNGRERPLGSPPARAVALFMFQHVEAFVWQVLGSARWAAATLGADGV